jgi:molybdate transport system substrate-binding protein
MRISRVAAIVGAVAAAGLVVAGIRRPDGPAPLPTTRTVRIAAASDLRYVLVEAAQRLREGPPALDLQVAYGSSGTFFAQIVNGAPYDLFMSADIDYPRQLETRGLTVAGSAFTYGLGRLVVWTPAGSPLDVETSGMQTLLNPRVRHVSIANPATAPYGRAAEAAMKQAQVYDGVRQKLVLGDNVAQALQFVSSGAADVGVIASSLAVAPEVKPTGRYWTVPLEMYPRMEQGGVILRTAADVSAAQAVRTFLLSVDGRALLVRYGFALPGGE